MEFDEIYRFIRTRQRLRGDLMLLVRRPSAIIDGTDSYIGIRFISKAAAFSIRSRAQQLPDFWGRAQALFAETRAWTLEGCLRDVLLLAFTHYQSCQHGTCHGLWLSSLVRDELIALPYFTQ